MIPPYGHSLRLADDGARAHPFRFHRAARRPLALLGVRPANAHVFVDAHVVHVSFGPWAIVTPPPTSSLPKRWGRSPCGGRWVCGARPSTGP